MSTERQKNPSFVAEDLAMPEIKIKHESSESHGEKDDAIPESAGIDYKNAVPEIHVGRNKKTVQKKD